MSKHKSMSPSPAVHRIEHAGAVSSAVATTNIAELDSDPAIENPAKDASVSRQGMHPTKP